jgi:hypothetical protein
VRPQHLCALRPGRKALHNSRIEGSCRSAMRDPAICPALTTLPLATTRQLQKDVPPERPAGANRIRVCRGLVARIWTTGPPNQFYACGPAMLINIRRSDQPHRSQEASLVFSATALMVCAGEHMPPAVLGRHRYGQSGTSPRCPHASQGWRAARCAGSNAASLPAFYFVPNLKHFLANISANTTESVLSFAVSRLSFCLIDQRQPLSFHSLTQSLPQLWFATSGFWPSLALSLRVVQKDMVRQHIHTAAMVGVRPAGLHPPLLLFLRHRHRQHTRHLRHRHIKALALQLQYRRRPLAALQATRHHLTARHLRRA